MYSRTCSSWFNLVTYLLRMHACCMHDVVCMYGREGGWFKGLRPTYDIISYIYVYCEEGMLVDL